MKRIGLALLAVISGGLIYLGYLGYFGGAVFVPVPAQPNASHSGEDLAAVVLSGDMGFNIGMSPKIAKRLSADGIPVIGVNSLVYFRHRRSPEEVALLIALAIERAATFGRANRVILVGQSFGADMIPVGLSRLSPALRAKVLMVGLIVPTDTLYLQASPSELFSWSAPDGDARPTAKKLNWIPVTCISGLEETESLCPHMISPNVNRIGLPGGHRLHGDADSIHRVLLDAIDEAADTRPVITPRNVAGRK